METGPVKPPDEAQPSKGCLWSLTIFYAFAGVHSAMLSIQDFHVAPHQPLRLALCASTIADVFLLGLYGYVFWTRDKMAFIGMNGLMMAALNAHTLMRHAVITLGPADWVQFAIPFYMAVALFFLWKKEA